MSAIPNGVLFDRYYYATGCGSPYENNETTRTIFDGIAERIVAEIKPASVLEAGCAIGYLVEGLRARGVEADGLDLSEYAISKARPGAKPYCWVGSVAEPFPKNYDLIVCEEVVEHMDPPDADRAIVNLCRHTNDVLFSSSPFDFKEATHYNVRPPEYWVEQFARQGFYPDVEFDASFLIPWAYRFRKGYQPIPRVLAAYERRSHWLKQQTDGIRQTALEMRNELARKDERLRELERLNQERERLSQDQQRLYLEQQRLYQDQQRLYQVVERERLDREQRLADVLASRSWRLTAPVRKVLSWIKGNS